MLRLGASSTFFFVLLCIVFIPRYATAYSEKVVSDVFMSLDVDKDGKISREEYAAQKVFVIYGDVPPPAGKASGGDLRFEDMQVNRKFFDSSDKSGDGKLSPVEIVDALKFERIAGTKDHITKQDFRRFMDEISP